MKKSTIIPLIGSVAIFCIFGSCEEDKRPKAPESKRMELDSTSQYYDQQYRVYTLEGCEYLVVGHGDMRWGSHKGNCKNPIHDK
jgi:hypothetical protein